MKIKIQLSTMTATVDTMTSLDEIQQAEPKFFAMTFGKRETYTMYKGCLIVRNTPRFTFSTIPPKRKTAVYIFDTKGKSTHCVSADAIIENIRQAKQLIDRILEKGSYSYGDNKLS